ncbi:MAG: hypothetical protein ACREVY_15105 [Gammaproteobacteria bacterium]
MGFEGFGGQEGYARLINFGQALLSNAYTVFVYLGFIAILVMLGLPEVPALRDKLHGASPPWGHSHQLRASVAVI